MSPFSMDVWMSLAGACLAVSMTLFFLGRICPAEWDNPYPCIEEPTELENQFSFQNSMWFAIGALLQQGSEIAPKYVYVREKLGSQSKCLKIRRYHIKLFFFSFLKRCIYKNCSGYLVVFHINYCIIVYSQFGRFFDNRNPI